MAMFERNYFLHTFFTHKLTLSFLKSSKHFSILQPSKFRAWSLNKESFIHFLSMFNSLRMLRVCQRWWQQNKWKAKRVSLAKKKKRKIRRENKNNFSGDYWQHNEKWLEKSIPHFEIKSFLSASEWFHQYPLIIFSFIC